MKASQLIKELQKAIETHGDLECLIEVADDDFWYLMPVDEVSYEKRKCYGESFALLM
jgi:hypothetical protein